MSKSRLISFSPQPSVLSPPITVTDQFYLLRYEERERREREREERGCTEKQGLRVCEVPTTQRTSYFWKSLTSALTQFEGEVQLATKFARFI